MEAAVLASSLVYGVVQGLLFGAVALGLSLIWGVMKVINLAHGELVVLGAYLLVVFVRLLHVDPLAAPLLDLAVGAVVGLAIYWALLHKIIGRAETITLKEEMATLLAMFGLSIALYQGMYIWTQESSLVNLYETVDRVGLYARLGAVTIGGVTIEAVKLLVAAVSVAAAAATHFFLNRSTVGLSIRAAAQDAAALSLVAINPVRVKALATVVGIALTMFAGGLLALYQGTGIEPGLAHVYAPISFAIVVLGTPGNLWGTMAAGVIVGLVFNLVYGFTGSLSLGLASSFALLVAALVVKPEGLFARGR